MTLEELVVKISGETSGLQSAMGSAISAVGKFSAAAVAAGATAVAALTKSAVESYADYEQLVGGVETLFKDSAGIVQEYAANAFQTAGLSANDYMETVTGFSASLLQSVGGDTEEAARIADQAITDMADNANKMGSSIESIQNAYQGFAKQNYTMLDNLKLGYGGTKQEMERLLADAEKLSGVHYDISNLNDVYEAIHVVQGELGITGTTAEEASTTIQGSAAAMKAAWQNMLTGIADENADYHVFIRDAFKAGGGQNMKFYKMDDFCKLAYVAADRLLEGIDFGEEECGMVLSGRYGCLDTDMKHQQVIDSEGDAGASPAVFVYTLPNVAAGEVSIRHHIKGENTWFWSDDRQMRDIRQYAGMMMVAQDLKYCIIGYFDSIAGKYEAVFKLLERQN